MPSVRSLKSAPSHDKMVLISTVGHPKKSSYLMADVRKELTLISKVSMPHLPEHKCTAGLGRFQLSSLTKITEITNKKHQNLLRFALLGLLDEKDDLAFLRLHDFFPVQWHRSSGMHAIC
jgi:hypothetical protein